MSKRDSTSRLSLWVFFVVFSIITGVPDFAFRVGDSDQPGHDALRLPGSTVLGGGAGGDSEYVTGDCNMDGQFDLADAIASFNYQFNADRAPRTCFVLCDADSNQRLDISDPILFLNHLFGAGKKPRPPLPPSEEVCDGIDNDCDGGIDEGCQGGPGISMTLVWDRVLTDEEGEPEDVKAYRLYYGRKSRDYASYVQVGSRPAQYTVSDLVPGVRYFFSVTAVDWANLESGFSAEATAVAR